MGKIGAVPVEKEVVDAVPTRFKEPGKLDRVFRAGNIEHDQPEISAALLHSDDGQVACDLDVEARAGRAHLCNLSHRGRVGDINDVHNAAKVAH